MRGRRYTKWGHFAPGAVQDGRDSVAIDLRRVVRNGSLYFLPIILVQVVSFLLLPLYTRYLTREDYGIVATAQASTAFLATVVALGPRSAVARLYFRVEGDRRALQILVSTSLIYVGLLSAAACALAAATLPWTAPAIFGQGVATGRIRIGMLVAFASIPFMGVMEHALMLLENAQRPKAYTFVRSATVAVTIVATVLLVVVGRLGALGSLLGLLVSAVAGACLGLVLIRSQLRLCFDRGVLGEVLRFGMPLVPVALSGWLVSWIDRFFLDHYRGLATTGVYAIAIAIGTAEQIVITAAMQAWTPMYYQQMEKRGKDAHADIARVSTLLFALFTFTGLGIAVFAPEIVQLLTRPSYRAAADAIPFLVLYFLLGSLGSFFSNSIYFAGKTKWLLITAVIPIVVLIPANLLLIPRLGATGAAMSVAVTSAVYTLVTLLIAQRVHPVLYHSREWLRIAVVAAALFLCARFIVDWALLPRLLAKALLMGIDAAALFAFGIATWPGSSAKTSTKIAGVS